MGHLILGVNRGRLFQCVSGCRIVLPLNLQSPQQSEGLAVVGVKGGRGEQVSFRLLEILFLKE
jgi:hypothetical protein